MRGKGVRLRVSAFAAGAAVLASGVAVAQSASDDPVRDARAAIQGGKARNVILLIGDGTGDSELTQARNYAYGAAGRMAMDTLPLAGAITTYSVEDSNPSRPDYVPDSAPTAGAWSTGTKSSDGRISTTPGTDQDVETILEIAQKRGMKVGNVTTADITDATPAAPSSHVAARDCRGPEQLATINACPQDRKVNGGPGSIPEQQVDKGIDVLLGGGKSKYKQTIDAGPDAGRTVIESAQRQGYSFVETANALAGIQPGQKVLGLFADNANEQSNSDLPVDWSFPGAPDPAQATAPGDTLAPYRCLEGRLPANVPSLEAMTRKALELLRSGSGPGFFLQVESASVDKQAHATNPCGQIGETVQLDAAVNAALEFQRANPDTLIIQTGDHAHTGQIIEASTSNAPGVNARLITDEGATMRVNYATGAGNNAGHTGASIPVRASGPQAAGILGTNDQTNVFRVMKRALAEAPDEPGPASTSTPTPAPPATPGGPRPRVAPSALSIRVSPSRDRRAPYRYVVSGKVTPPAGLASATPCEDGAVTLALRKGSRTVAFQSVALSSRSCSFSGRLTVRSRSDRGRYAISARFTGSELLKPARLRTLSARAG